MFYTAIHTAVPPVLRAIWRPAVEGSEHVPLEGPVLLASLGRQPVEAPVPNLAHAAVLESTIILAATDGRLWSVEGQRAVPLEISDPKP